MRAPQSLLTLLAASLGVVAIAGAIAISEGAAGGFARAVGWA